MGVTQSGDGLSRDGAACDSPRESDDSLGDVFGGRLGVGVRVAGKGGIFAAGDGPGVGGRIGGHSRDVGGGVGKRADFVPVGGVACECGGGGGGCVVPRESG